jgi:predicted ATPase
MFAYTTPGADLSFFMRDIDVIEPYADRAIAISDEYKSFAQYRGQALIHKGWAMASRREFDVAIPFLAQALGQYYAIAAGLLAGRLTAEVAEAYGMAGRAEEGLEILARSPDRVRGKPVRFAEIFRVEGELMLAKAEPDGAAAERLFQEAIEIAREEGSICWELRSAICLARLWLQQGNPTGAEDLLAPIYARFEEGFDTTDLKEARLLLDALRAPTRSKERI